MVFVDYAVSGESYSISVAGHADYAEKGKDIVCAGISALLRGLQEVFDNCLYLSDAAHISKRVEEGFASFSVSGMKSEYLPFFVQGAFYACIDGLIAIEEQYPDCITINDISASSQADDIDTSEQTMNDE